MLTIEYCAEGEAVNDFNFVEWRDNAIQLANSNTDTTIKVSTSLPIELTQLYVVSKDVSHTNIRFKFQDKFLAINEYGAIPEYPYGFADINSRVSEHILRKAMLKRKEEKHVVSE